MSKYIEYKPGYIRIAGIIRESIVDGPGLRFVIFCQGCIHKCPGCHNPESHDFQGGYDCEIEKIIKAVDDNPLLQGVTFSGGEPFNQAEAFLELAKILKAKGIHIMSYSGFTFEELMDMAKTDDAVRELMNNIDILVDGRFVQEERDLSLIFRGSRNQRVLDLKKSLESGEAVWDDRYK
ncbi:MAG: anaerobic ribonucleoside-triphosphate reductase activating protein [Clostridia bacterium]|nr:anaerobic ribonucleoside-triphosphate reductase activating protein [Clostridia bacterium]